ncbi:hypothetical protein [Xylanivirga thermophila]|uniref:hypothetical protein n=1 Tax=Xylanivirga thermophila TaxID=2496273 RepID=UPI00101DA905|nr:hypothetical protein [Xylanivirga thermophila]
MKKLICTILVALALVVQPINVFASSLDSDFIFNNSVTIEERFEEGVGTWKMSSLENITIYLLENVDGTLEYAYLDENGVVQYTELKEGVITRRSYDDDYFNTQEECLSAEEETLIDDIVIKNGGATSVELEKAFKKAGLYNVTVFEEDGGLYINPFGAQNIIDSNPIIYI